MTKQIRTLPPGLDALQQQVTFGTMWIKVGTLKLIRSTSAQYNVLCQFWGQNTPASLSTRFDTPNNEQERMQKYNIKCPITVFAEYLQEMKSNLRLQVENVGKISLDMTKFLKKNLNIDSRQAFEHFKGFFQVIGKGNRKAGSLQIQMGSEFDPQIALRQLGEQAFQEIRKSELQKCPASKLQVFECCGHCECVCQRYKRKVKKQIQKQQKSNDPRIPHSLDTKPREQKEFDPNKYQSKGQPLPSIKKTEQVLIKKESEQSQKREQNNHPDRIKQNNQQFPEVPKILTYSNLRLNFDDPQIQMQISKQNEELGFLNIHKQTSKGNRLKIDIGQSVEEKIQIKSKPKISKQELLNQFYGVQNSPFKINEQLDNDPHSQGSYQKGYHQGNGREKLSKVINLNEQLEKESRIKGPPLLIDNILQKSESFHETYQKTGMQRKPFRKSSLILSLFIQIDKNKINLPINEPFLIAYRPYGQKERLTLGPNFASPIHILSNVGENEVMRMNKTPLIIQFWTASQNKFIGLIRIDLSKIKKGFILQDRLNQIAIKTNILPTVIHRGATKVIDLSDKQVGSCDLYAAIGTANQLNTYLNQKQSEPKQKPVPNPIKNIEDPQKQPYRPPIKRPQTQQQPHTEHQNYLDNNHLLINFDQFLQTLYKNNNHIIEVLNKLMNQQYVNRQQFNQLGKSIGIQSLNILFDLHHKIKKDEKDSKQVKENIDFHQIAESFDDFIEIMQTVREQFAVCSKTVKNLFVDPSLVLAKIKQQSPMQLINKKKLFQIMSKFTKYPFPIEQLLKKINQYVNIEYISHVLSNRTQEIPQLIHISKQYLDELIVTRLIETLMKKGFTVDKMINKFSSPSSVDLFQFAKWIHQEGFGASLWAILHFLQFINRSEEFQMHKINIQKIQAYFNKYNQKKTNSNQIKKFQELKLNQNLEEPHHIIAQNQNQKLPQQEHSQVKMKQQIKKIIPPEQNNSLNNVLDNLHKNEEEKKQPVNSTIYKHLFSINPVELSLQNPIKGNCVVIYEFPFDEEQVKSKNFITTVDKHKYPLKMYGTHGFTIEESPHSYLGDNVVKFYVKIDKRIQYEGALPSDELLISPNTEQDKIIPLFSDRTDGIAGKIRLNIHFERALATDNALGKQTTYQLFLPKTGYLNYSLTSQIQSTKIRSQLNLKEQFYIALVFDLFYHNSSLRTQFPPVSSKLYSDSSDTAQLRGSIKMSLSPVILQYLKTNNARLSLNIIYYSKENGNFQRKQIPYATIQLPIINVIKAEGIKGDYAFKNKLGMFVTLANCVLKYDKDPISKLSSKEENDKSLTAYWLILNFLQFISFQTHKFNWIKIQFVLKGRKYSTEKLQLEPYSVNFFNNSGVMIKFNQQDFTDTKVIPVTILTNTSERFGIDINLKAISKDVVHKKYSINNQYYIVVNQSSKPTKMRLGLKTYCFRGGPLLSNFVSSLYQHLDTEVFEEMEMPKSIENYEQMVNIFKNKLKLTQKGLQQALSQLDVNKGKLHFQFFTNRTYYKLDFTPILAQTEADIDFICEQLETETTKEDILQYFSDNKIKLQNFRPEFLERFSFKELNKIKADKNVQFLSVDSCIDLIAFVRKIKILQQEEPSSSYINQTTLQQKNLDLTVLEGMSFEKLYNGIKPNSIIRVPQLGLQTQVSHRNSNPYFNQNYQCELDKQSLIILRNLKIEVYHCTNQDDDGQNIMIGQGYINLNPSDIKNGHKIVKVTINSLMSNRMKAYLNVKLGLVDSQRSHRDKSKQADSSGRVQQSAQASRIGQILQDIRQEMAYKNKLFESSDDEQY